MVLDGVTKICINLSNGLYVFSSMGAAGKTYLGSWFKTWRALGRKVETISVDEVNDRGLSCIQEIQGNEYEAILFDRFDLYCTDAWLKLVKDLAKRTIVLLDLKIPYAWLRSSEYGVVYLLMSKDKLEVYQVENDF